MKRIPWLFFALALLGGAFFIVTRIGLNYSIDETNLAEDARPDAYLSDYRIRFYNTVGQLYLNLSGTTLTHRSKTQMNQADHPELYHISPDGQRWDMQAARVTYPFTGQMFTLDGGVRIAQLDSDSPAPDGDTRLPEILLTTPDLVYYPHIRRIFTASPVVLESTQGRLTVAGIEGFLNERRFILPAQVRGTYHDD